MSEMIVNKLTGKTSAGDIDVTVGSTTQQLQNGMTKAWGLLNQSATADALYSSFNLASSADLGTGQSQMNFTSNFTDGLYATPSATESGVGFNDVRTINRDNTQTRSSSRYEFYNVHGGTSSADNSQYVSVVFFGDLA